MAAVVFDLDGVLLESEPLWSATRREVAETLGGRWTPQAEQAMKGMSSPEWSGYMQRELDIARSSEEIVGAVLGRMTERYRKSLPVVDGAGAAVERLAASWPLGLASSSNRALIDLVLELADWSTHFDVTVSSEEVGRGKPAPDVYLEAARRLKTATRSCVAIEDSGSGIRSAAAAGMHVIALPGPEAPLELEELGLTATVLASPAQLAVEVVEPLVSDEVPTRPLEHTRVQASADLSPASWRLNFGPEPGPGNSDGG
jgi:HAD superfamily hydrolase (TIGR01509 family)